MSISKRVLRGAGWMTIVSYANMILSFLGNVLLARLLFPEDFGIYTLAFSVTALVFMIAGFGAQEAIVQCRDENVIGLIPTAFWMTFALSFTLAIIGSLVGIIAQGYYGNNVAQIIFALSWMSLLSNITHAYTAILQRKLAYKPIAIAGIISTIVALLCALALAYNGFGAWSLVSRDLVTIIIRLVLLSFASGYGIKLVFDRTAAKWIYDFGVRVMVLRINEVLSGRVDNLLVGRYFGVTVLGYYGLAYRLALTGYQLVQGAIQTASTAYATLQKSPDKLIFTFERMYYWLWRSVLLIGIVVAISGQNLVVILYTDKWATAGRIFQAFFAFLIFMPLSENLKEFLIGSNNINEVIKARYFQIAVFFVSIGLAVTFGNILAVVWAVNFSVFVGYILLMYSTRKVGQISWGGLMWKPLFSGIITLSMSFFFANWLEPHLSLLFSTIIEIIFIFICYTLLLIIFERDKLFSEWKTVYARVR